MLCFSSFVLNACQSLPDYAFTRTTRASYEQIETRQFSLQDKQDLVGNIAIIKTREHDTLVDIARHFSLGYNDITIANPQLDPWVPEANSQVVLPLKFIIPDQKRTGIILNLPSMRLFYFPEHQPDQLLSYPVGIGRDDWRTPTGISKIIGKKTKPDWHVPVSILREHAKKGDPLPRIVPAGPDNPLGQYAMRLSLPSYLIHGTNKPYGVGMQISHGCIRLYPENIAELFPITPMGTQVNIINQPYLLGWEKGMLFLEAHHPLYNNIAEEKRKLRDKLTTLSKKKAVAIDWQAVEKIIGQARGIPEAILQQETGKSTTNTVYITHPQNLYLKPRINPIRPQDWSIKITQFANNQDARKLAAMLNHQSPIIPSRVKQYESNYHVVAGPYRDQHKINAVIKKIKKDFQLLAVEQTPGTFHHFYADTSPLWNSLFD